MQPATRPEPALPRIARVRVRREEGVPAAVRRAMELADWRRHVAGKRIFLKINTLSLSAVPELVRDGVEGVQCPPDPAAQAAAIRRLLGDEAERQRLAANARTRTEAYDWGEIARRFEEILTRLLAGVPHW